jgi:hypothetical protein
MVQYFPIVTGSLTVTGSVNVSGSITTNSTITATTLVVQTITSSVSAVTGSTNFGSLVSNTHTFTGSLNVTGGLAVTTNGVEFQVNPTGVNLGNALTDSHVISGSLRVNPNGLFVSSSGLVGIGTSSPSQLLEVSVTSQDDGVRITSSNSKPTLRFYSSFSNSSNRNWAISPNGQNFGDLQICTSAAQNGDPTAADRLTRLLITSAGNIQIDNGQLNTPKSLYFQANSNTGGNLGSIDWYNVQWDGFVRAQIKGETDTGLSNGRLVFSTGGGGVTERMRITSGGSVFINTSAAAITSNMRLSVKQTLGEGAAEVWTSWAGDVSTAALWVIKFDNVNSTSQIFQRFAINNGGTACGQINANGASQVAFGSYSDIRLKENITELEPQLDKILALKPCEFDYKDGSGHQIGFIAQEMQEVYPDVVNESLDGMLTLSGWNKTEARLVKAIQELTARVQELENK